MPPPGKPGRFNPFNGLLWALFLTIALYLLAWPPLEGLWARKAWKPVPCYAPAANAQFFFDFNGKTYGSTRRTLWTVIHAAPFAATPGAAMIASDVCYVREDARGGPGIAVLTPVAPPTQEQLMSRLAILVMVFVAVLIMTWRVRKALSAQAAPGSPVAAP